MPNDQVGHYSPAQMPLLQVTSLSKSFPGVQALKDVSFELNQGEILAVIGENGAGKSTLMRILAGVQTPDSGLIKIDDRSGQISSVQSALRLGVALLQPGLNLSPNVTVADKIYVGAEPKAVGFF